MRRPAASILAAARRMERMLRDLSDSARAESGKLELSPRPLALAAFVAEFLHVSDGVLEVGRVENAVPPSLPEVLADPDRLDRILANLVGTRSSTRGRACASPPSRWRARCGSRSPTRARG